MPVLDQLSRLKSREQFFGLLKKPNAPPTYLQQPISFVKRSCTSLFWLVTKNRSSKAIVKMWFLLFRKLVRLIKRFVFPVGVLNPSGNAAIPARAKTIDEGKLPFNSPNNQ